MFLKLITSEMGQRRLKPAPSSRELKPLKLPQVRVASTRRKYVVDKKCVGHTEIPPNSEWQGSEGKKVVKFRAGAIKVSGLGSNDSPNSENYFSLLVLLRDMSSCRRKML